MPRELAAILAAALAATLVVIAFGPLLTPKANNRTERGDREAAITAAGLLRKYREN